MTRRCSRCSCAPAAASASTRRVVPDEFPLAARRPPARQRHRGHGRQGFFDDRRRVKSEAELAGIRRAQRAAEAGMAAGRDLLRRAEARNGGLVVDGEPLTCELIKLHAERAFSATRRHVRLVHRLSRRPDGGRARHGLGPDCAGRRRPLRLLPSRPRVGLLRRHDADVRRRRRARRGDPRVPPPRQAGARPAASRRSGRGSPGRSCTRWCASSSTSTASRRSCTRRPTARCSTPASTTRPATGSGSRCTSSRAIGR